MLTLAGIGCSIGGGARDCRSCEMACASSVAELYRSERSSAKAFATIASRVRGKDGRSKLGGVY